MKYSIVLALAIACIGCKSKEKVEPFNTNEVFVAIDQNLITYRANEFHQKCIALQSVCESYLKGNNSINDIQKSWKEALDTWSYLELYNMYSIQDDFIQNRIAKAPINSNFVEAYINDSSLTFNSDFINTIGSTSKGLFCVEYLLYENAERLVGNEQRHNYLQALCDNLVSESEELETMWLADSPSYQANLTSGVSSSLNTTLNQMISLIEKMIYVKHGPVEFDTLQYAAYRSRSSLAILKANLKSIRATFQGDTLGGVSLGIDDMLIYHDASYEGEALTTKILNLLDELDTNTSLYVSLESSVSEQSALRAEVYEDLKLLLLLFKGPVITALDATLSVSDNDGD